MQITCHSTTLNHPVKRITAYICKLTKSKSTYETNKVYAYYYFISSGISVDSTGKILSKQIEAEYWIMEKISRSLRPKLEECAKIKERI